MEDKETAVKKLMDFCEREGIEWHVVVVAEEQLSGGGLIVRPRVVVDYKKEAETTRTPTVDITKQI